MKLSTVTPTDIARSVWAVPPLALTKNCGINNQENARLVKHIEAGGVSTILWGGNAAIYSMTRDEYGEMISSIPDWVSGDCWAIPSAGPDYGKMREHADILKNTRFPAALLLPMAGPTDAVGTERAVRDFCDRAGMPAILYLRTANYLPAERIAALVDEGLVVAIKYAVETGNFAQDSYLDDILAQVKRDRIVSGIGELAGIEHLRHFNLAGFTAGIVCIAPRRAMAILKAAQARDFAAAERLGEALGAVESLRNDYGPVRVMHDAVTLSGVAEMGPLLPHLSNVSEPIRSQIAAAVSPLIAAEMNISEAVA